MNLTRLSSMAATAAVSLGLLFGGAPAFAQDSQPVTSATTAAEGDGPEAIILTGGTGGPASAYGYVGALVPFPGSRIGNGWVGQYWVDYTTYNFNFNGQRIDAQVPGVEALVGYQGSTESGSYWGFFVGPEWRNTTFNNNFQSNVAGSRLGVKGQFSGEGVLSDSFRLNGIASYTTADQYHWVRGRALVGGEGIRIGPEIVFQGNPTFEGRQYGLALTNIGLSESAFVELHGGYETTRGLTGVSPAIDGAYFGVDLIFLVGNE